MDRDMYRKILDENPPSARTLRMSREGVIPPRQQKEWIKKKHIRVMKWLLLVSKPQSYRKYVEKDNASSCQAAANGF